MHIPNSEPTVNACVPSVGPSKGPTSRQHYARPLNEMYACVYVHHHKQIYEMEQQIEADCQAALAKVNTIQLFLWAQVCFLFSAIVMGAKVFSRKVKLLHICALSLPALEFSFPINTSSSKLNLRHVAVMWQLLRALLGSTGLYRSLTCLSLLLQVLSFSCVYL